MREQKTHRAPSARITRTCRENIEIVCRLRGLSFSDWLNERAAKDRKRIERAYIPDEVLKK